jgi:hypothetical protein
MSEVRRHQRVTASGKRTTVRHHTRGGDRTTRREDEAQAAREAWADRNAPHVSTLTPAEPEPQAEEWWAGDDGPPPGEFWDDDEPEREPSPAFAAMQDEMRDWRSRDIDVPRGEPDTSPLGRVLGTDTQEGADKFARLKAYRDAGYEGPLDSDNRIPDPDDPQERPALEALAYMREQHG